MVYPDRGRSKHPDLTGNGINLVVKQPITDKNALKHQLTQALSAAMMIDITVVMIRSLFFVGFGLAARLEAKNEKIRIWGRCGWNDLQDWSF